jgi:hypothetical protein
MLHLFLPTDWLVRRGIMAQIGANPNAYRIKTIIDSDPGL